VFYFDDVKLIGYGHDGSWGGFRTTYYRYLAEDRTTVILSNRGNFDRDAFWYPINALIEKRQEPPMSQALLKLAEAKFGDLTDAERRLFPSVAYGKYPEFTSPLA